MPILSVRDVQRSYGEHVVLQGASLALEAGERVGLVGRNGAGKSTLCRILAGLEEPDSGEVVRTKGLRLAYLEQEPAMEAKSSALDVVLGGLERWRAAMERHDAVSKQLEAGAGEEQLDELLSAQAEAAATVEDCGGWSLDHQAEAVLQHLGVHDAAQLVGTMSGGERRRVALARLLVAGPELAIIDEPTNHLDIPTIEWLERWLEERFTGALLLVTHDRYVLSRLVSRTAEVENGAVHVYQGGWESYLAAKAEREAHAQRVDSNRRNYLRRELEWLRRQPKARTTKSKARVDRVEAVRAETSATRHADASIEMAAERSGRAVLEADELRVDVAGRTLVEDLTLRISKGHRIGILGPNGCGKTSLLNVLMGEVPPSSGRVTRARNAKVAFLDQARAGLDPNKTVYDLIAQGGSVITLGDKELSVRAYLERFLFRSDEHRKLASVLSGGERARVSLARTLREAAQLVVLDEPTNDLDVSTLAALEDALLSFSGAALIVTHDRWFLDRVATSILAFEADGTLELHAGNYADYQARRAARARDERAEAGEGGAPPSDVAAGAKSAPKGGGASGGSLTYAERIELDGLMQKIESVEAQVAEMDAELAAPEFYERAREAQQAFLEKRESAREQVERLTRRWEELEARREP